jgi:hypothetical protein
MEICASHHRSPFSCVRTLGGLERAFPDRAGGETRHDPVISAIATRCRPSTLTHCIDFTSHIALLDDNSFFVLDIWSQDIGSPDRQVARQQKSVVHHFQINDHNYLKLWVDCI